MAGAKRLSPLTPVVRGLIFLLAGAAAARDDLARGDLGLAGTAVLGLLVLGACYGAASWWLTKFRITEEELRVDTGVLHRRSRRVRLGRIAEIDLVQPFVARLFGLAQVRLDVAGGADREVSLSFLSNAEAARVKSVLLARRERALAEHPDDAAGLAADEQAPSGREPGPGERELARVDPALQVMALAATPVASGLLVGAAALFWLGHSDHPAAAAVALPVVGSLALVLVRDLSENWGFRLSEDHLGLHVRRGMANVTAQTISTERLHGLVVTEPVAWRWFGWARLDVCNAGSIGVTASGPDASTVLSVGRAEEVWALAARLLGREGDLSSVALLPPPTRARWAEPGWWRGLAAGSDEDVVACRRGLLRRRTHVVFHRRIQSLRLVQGPLQRLLGLATLVVDSPPGPVRVVARHREAAEARALLEREVSLSERARLLLPG